MITLMLGAPGSGKSYEAVAHQVLPALRKGRKVVTNLPLVLEKFAMMDPSYVDLIELRHASKDNPKPFSSLKDYNDPWRHEKTGSGPLYVIDECHIPLPRGNTSRDVDEWYSLHRHESSDVILITQSHSKVSRSVIELVQVCIRLRKNVALGSTKSYLRKVQDGVKGAVVNTTTRRYDKAFFGLYKSHTKNGGEELALQDVKSIWRHPIFYLLAFCLVFFVYRVSTHGISFPGVGSSVAVHKPAAKGPGPAVTPPVKPPVQAVAPVSASGSHAVTVPTASDDKNLLKHPFDGYTIGLAGELHDHKGVQVELFTLASNGVVIRTLDEREMKNAGYVFKPMGFCAGLVTFPAGEFKTYVRCETPRLAVPMPVVGRAST